MIRTTLNWTVKNLKTMYDEKETLSFTHPIQRQSAQWDNEQQSLLIHSMLANFPVPAVYVHKTESIEVDAKGKHSYNYSVLDGKEYTKERIRERIELKHERKATIPKRDYASRRLVDTSDEKFQTSPGLKRWATIENLKIAAQSYAEAESITKLEHEIAVKTEAGKSAKQSVVELEHRIKDLAEIIKYAQQYRANRSYHIGYKKAKNPDAYFRRYESQIILYAGARRMLEQAGINLKSLNIDMLKSKHQELTRQKNELTSTYKTYEKEVRELSRKLDNLNQYLGRDTTSALSSEQQDKSKNQIL